jgi:hypothetical protein
MATTDGTALVEAMKGMSWVSPRGPISIDPKTRDIIQNVYVRKVEKVNGELYNVEFSTRHCEHPGLAFGKPEYRLREAIQRAALDILLDCFVAALLAMTKVLFSIGLVFMAIAATDYLMGSQQQNIRLPAYLQGRMASSAGSPSASTGSSSSWSAA